MDNISKEDLFELLKNSKSIENKIISLNEIDIDKLYFIDFINCVFTSNQIIFIDKEISNIKKKYLLLVAALMIYHL